MSSLMIKRVRRHAALPVVLSGLIMAGCASFDSDQSNVAQGQCDNAFGPSAIERALAAGELEHVYLDGRTVKPEPGYSFKELTVTLPDGGETKRFQLFDDNDEYAGIELACSCDGASSSGACTQIGSQPFGITCGGSCDGCEAFILWD